LLDHGAALGTANAAGWTPLNCAAYKGHSETVRFLLERGASVSTTSNTGWAPLYAASAKGHLDVARMLLERGAATDQANGKGLTPVRAAAREGLFDGVLLLLEHNASVGNDHEAWNLFRGAVVAGHAGVLNALLDRGVRVPRKHWAPFGVLGLNLLAVQCGAVPPQGAGLGLGATAGAFVSAWRAGETDVQRERRAVEAAVLSASAEMPEAVALLLGDYVHAPPRSR
jgi:ankyrin repeat protein